ncbi:interleukin-17 receptor C isoform X2 [Betta splendens]|uniref:Interleukin-17 receptor C isoform X2 n=1 Tax=Betta splendens TaxID=158456 RepID=A0A6P7MY52_BETSP|nr:interleukin-17 receptor C isoform X2 [Betta splendens]
MLQQIVSQILRQRRCDSSAKLRLVAHVTGSRRPTPPEQVTAAHTPRFTRGSAAARGGHGSRGTSGDSELGLRPSLTRRIRGRRGMAPTLLRVPVALLVLRLSLFTATSLETVNRDAPEVTCSEGLSDCRVSPASLCLDSSESVDVSDVGLQVLLCCADAHDCHPCLQITVSLRVDRGLDVSGEFEFHGDEEESSDKLDTAEGSAHKSAVVLGVCLSSPVMSPLNMRIEFTPSASSWRRPSHPATQMVQLVLKQRLLFDSAVEVDVSSNRSSSVRTITVPSLEDVCLQHTDTVKDCDAPRLRVVLDHERERVHLELVGPEPSQTQFMCQMFWDDPHGVTRKCVWWNDKDIRRNVCPFKDQQEAHERMQKNVFVTMAQFAAGTHTALLWNVSAPCRLEAEVWLCKKDAVGGECQEVTGSRQALLGHRAWTVTGSTHWSQSGEFNATAHPLLCLQIRMNSSYLEPYCPFAASRWRWGLSVLLALLLVGLAVLGAYLVQGVLKGYVWRWLKEEDVKGAVGGGHVVLLYPPDDDKALPGLMCHLGSSLRALGFSVSLDLWSQAELGALGPVPWLHSRLDQLKRQGGKVVLVLTQAAWIRAEEWGAHGCSRRSRDAEEEEAKGRARLQASGDVFSASLSCVLADYLQGRAGERFTLVQFESLPPEPPGGFRPLPQLFRGLHLYSLPSQSLGFLTELAGARQAASAAARRRRAGGLRMASRALASGLASFTAGTAVLRLAGVSHGRAEEGETVPLQPCMLTPPSSPDASPKLSDRVWL